MTRYQTCCWALVFIVPATLLAGSSQTIAPPDPVPVEPVTALIEALRTHDIVAMHQPHGNEQSQAILLALVRDPRFPTVAQDIVLESANARYQDVLSAMDLARAAGVRVIGVPSGNLSASR